MSADLESRALRLLRHACFTRDLLRAHEACAYATGVLVADGVDGTAARKAVKAAWDEHFAVMGPN